MDTSTQTTRLSKGALAITLGLVLILLVGGIYAVRVFASRGMNPASDLAAKIASYQPRIEAASSDLTAKTAARKDAEKVLADAKAEETSAENSLNGLRRAYCELNSDLNRMNGIPPVACPDRFPTAGK
jgi:hypothetical protein